MKYIFMLCCFLFIGCAGNVKNDIVRTAVTSSNTSELLAETAQTTAESVYRAEQQAALDQVKQSGGTKEDARNAIWGIRSKWDDVWKLFAKIREAHSMLVLAIKAYDQGTGTLDDMFAQQETVGQLYKDVTSLLSQNRSARKLP